MSLIHSPVALMKGMRTRFLRKFVETRTDLLRLATILPSDTDIENYAWIDELPRMREFLTERQVTGLADARYDVENRTFESTMSVKRTHLADGKVAMIRMRLDEMAAEAKGHPMTLMAEQLANGHLTTVTTDDGTVRRNVCYDGGAFFSTGHPARGQQVGTQSNLMAGSGTGVAALSADWAAVKSRFGRIVDAGGKAWRRSWGEIIIVCPPELENAWKTVLEADLISNTSNVQKGQASYMVMPELTDQNDWYALHVGGELKPICFQSREDVEFVSLDDPEVHEPTFFRDLNYYGARYRGAGAYGFWQDAQKVTN